MSIGFRYRSLTILSLAGLAAGLGLGIVGQRSGSGMIASVAAALEPFGEIWVSALQLLVLPLVIAHVLAAVVGAGDRDSIGSLGARALGLFVGLLAVAGLFTVIVAPPLIRLLAPAAPRFDVVVPSAVAARASGGGDASLGEWLSGLVPTNIFDAAARGDLLPILLFTALFGLAVRRLDEPYREPMRRVFQGAAEAMLWCVRWVLSVTPVAVFILTLSFSLQAGGAGAQMLAAFALIVSALMLLFTALLYPLSALLGGIGMATFARAVAPAQLVAVSTRSSLASLPALVEGARAHLRLPAPATSFVLPLSVSVFKLNRTISSPVKLLFLAHVYQVSLTPHTMLVFLLTVMLLSFTSAGVPNGGAAFKTLPAYVAAGVPIEGVIILEAVETIPDIFKTLLNVTGDMSVATILTGQRRSAQVAAGQTAMTPDHTFAPSEGPTG
ncbi:MAG: dicarboxylate/amino acid:cation symporter [Gemmatimonadota bacterium]